VDRQALARVEATGVTVGTPYEAPRTELERELAAIWQTVLHHDRVGIHDNFFDLGGDSLRAFQVLSRICHALHVNLPLRGFFEAPTIAGLALLLAESGVETLGLKEDVASPDS